MFRKKPRISPAVADFRSNTKLTAVPDDFNPATKRIELGGCTALTELPAGIDCNELNVGGTAIQAIPAGTRVAYRLDAAGCTGLHSLPEGLTTGSLVLADCVAIQTLPAGISARFLDLSNCVALDRLPDDLDVRHGRLRLRNCSELTSIPDGLGPLAQLDISGCPLIRALPEQLEVVSWIDIAGSGVTAIPEASAGAQLRWRGVPVERRIAFEPESITAAEVLGETNAEVRRVKLERMGFDRFLAEAEAETLDQDTDPGGDRRLLRVALGDDEPLVCLSVHCPSTDRQFVLRVPPNTKSCAHGAAWLAGFDNPKKLRLVQET